MAAAVRQRRGLMTATVPRLREAIAIAEREQWRSVGGHERRRWQNDGGEERLWQRCDGSSERWRCRRTGLVSGGNGGAMCDGCGLREA